MTAVAVAAKLFFFLADLAQEQMAMFTIFVNIFIVLIGSFFTVRKFKMTTSETNMILEVKAGMKTTTLFAVFMTVFVFIYYSYVDTHYFPELIADRVDMAKAAAVDNPDINIENIRKIGEVWFSPKTHATITLLGLTISGAIYSFLIALLMRKIRGFGRK